jgi:hypothetical protein
MGDDKLADVLSTASSLQHRWRQRFKHDYVAIDDGRLKKLLTEGALHDIVPNLGERKIPQIWQIEKTTPLADKDLDPGMYDLHCPS